jgi:probable phosphoglycerate mutase
MSDAVDVYLVRHGEAESNAFGYVTSAVPGPPLTPLGRRQAEAVAALLAARLAGHARLVASPLRRARDTARPTAARLGLETTVTWGLRELSMGGWEGRPARTLLQEEPEFAAWRTDPEAHGPPGGERASAVGRRVRAALEATLADMPVGDTLVAFSHQDAIGALLTAVRGMPWTAMHTWKAALPNAVIAWLRYSGDGAWSLVDLDPAASRAPLGTAAPADGGA